MDPHALMSDPQVKTFFVHFDAMRVLERMFGHTRAVRQAYGAASPEHLAQAESLTDCLTAVLTRPGLGRAMRISSDGQLSLLCNENNAYTFGMIFFRDRAHDGAPIQPGTWSLHS